MTGDLPTLQDVMERAREIQQHMVLAHADMVETELTGTSDGGLVTVTMRGDGEVTRLVFDQAAVDEGDAQALAALTLTALRHAREAVKSLAAEKMTAVAGDLEALNAATAGG